MLADKNDNWLCSTNDQPYKLKWFLYYDLYIQKM